jgi:hypothetical protein
MNCTQELQLFREREARRRASTNKSKKRPEYREKIKEYNKRYYQNRKEKEKSILQKVFG